MCLLPGERCLFRSVVTGSWCFINTHTLAYRASLSSVPALTGHTPAGTWGHLARHLFRGKKDSSHRDDLSQKLSFCFSQPCCFTAEQIPQSKVCVANYYYCGSFRSRFKQVLCRLQVILDRCDSFLPKVIKACSWAGDPPPSISALEFIGLSGEMLSFCRKGGFVVNVMWKWTSSDIAQSLLSQQISLNKIIISLLIQAFVCHAVWGNDHDDVSKQPIKDDYGSTTACCTQDGWSTLAYVWPRWLQSGRQVRGGSHESCRCANGVCEDAAVHQKWSFWCCCEAEFRAILTFPHQRMALKSLRVSAAPHFLPSKVLLFSKATPFSCSVFFI